mgnify:CR=1 FL=1
MRPEFRFGPNCGGPIDWTSSEVTLIENQMLSLQDDLGCIEIFHAINTKFSFPHGILTPFLKGAELFGIFLLE